MEEGRDRPADLASLFADDDLLSQLGAARLDEAAPLDPLCAALLEWRRDVNSEPLPADPATYA